MIKAGVYGATGYTGYETLRLLRWHPEVRVMWATSRSYSGKTLGDAFATVDPQPLIAAEEADPAACDVVFLCLPHGATVPTALQALEAGARVIDLSADFRLQTSGDYQTWYGKPHAAPQWLDEAVYGLCELNRERITSARLVANPGCYPTSVLLALLPLQRAGLLDGQVIVDAKSGVSGAGRSLALKSHFVEANENFAPYNIGHSHRHIAEMEQELAAYGPRQHVIFSPHLLPVNRGILSTIYLRLSPDTTEAQVRELYEGAYADEPFVHLLPPDQLPTLRYVVNTNHCVLQPRRVDDRGNWIIVSVIDNLLKGAAGQAVQNMNIMFGQDETRGLLF